MKLKSTNYPIHTIKTLGLSHVTGGNVKWYSHLGELYGSFLWNWHTILSSCCTLRYSYREIKIYAYPKICILMYSFVCNRPKLETAKECTAHGQINKLWHIHNMKHYLVIKRINYQCIQQHKWISKAPCQVKKSEIKEHIFCECIGVKFYNS